MRNSLIDRATEHLRRALDRAARWGAAAKLAFTQNEQIGCSFENGRLKGATSHQGVGVNVEVLAGGRRGRTACTRLEDVEDMVDRAIVLAQAGSPAHFDAYPPPAPVADVRTCSDRTASLTREDLIDRCRTFAEAMRRHDEGLFIEAGGSRNETESLLVTSGGVCHADRGTVWGLWGGVQRTRGTDMLFAHHSRSWRDVNELYDPELIIREVLEDLRRSERTAEAPAGRTTALLDPGVVARFGWVVALGVNGRNVAKGDSPLRGRLGEQVCDPCLTLLDDPHLDHAPGACRIDSDGIPTRRQAIIRAGVLERFLYDLDSAGLAGAEPTGNTGCAPYSLDLAPGRRSSEELLAGIDEGIYVKDLLGFGQSNVLNGDFAANVALGYRIRRGEIIGRIKNTMIAGNVYELLRSGVQPSSDRDPVRRAPFLVVEGVSVSAGKA